MARVLVIDDHSGTRETTGLALRAAGHEVCLSPNGLDGLNAVRREAFDIVFVDLRLPDMSGLDVIAGLKTINQSCVIILTTAFPEPLTALEASRLKVDDYMPGLLFIEEILNVVEVSIATRPPCQPATTTSSVPKLDGRVLTTLKSLRNTPSTSLPDLAGSVRLSESHLRHLFLDTLGLTFSRVATSERLAHVSRRLLECSDSVAQIATSAGWLDLRHFRKLFRSRFGMTPRDYRIQHRHIDGPEAVE